MVTRKSTAACLLYLLLASWFAATPALAQRSFFTTFDRDAGLDVGEIAALAQDDAGFIWIGAHRGLVRFDGRNFVAWAPEQLDEVVYQILRGPDGELLVRAASGHGWRCTPRGLEPLVGPSGTQVENLESFDYDARGNLWAVLGRELWRRNRDGKWSRLDGRQHESVRRVYAFGDDIVVLTDRSARRVDAKDDWSLLLRAQDLWFAARAADGSMWLATHFNTGLWRIDAGGTHALQRPSGRALDLRPRGSTMWLAMDQTLLAMDANGESFRMTVDDGLPSGGPLLVDREGSLWLGTFIGLVQFPQPDTLQWTDRDGLPSVHAYAIAVQDGTVFASTWGALAHMNKDTGGRFVVDFRTNGGMLCVDKGFGVLTSDASRLDAWRGGRFVPIATWARPTEISGCANDGKGSLWLATSTGLFRWRPPQLQSVAIDRPGDIDLVWFDDAGRMRATIGQSECELRNSPDGSKQATECVRFSAAARANAIAAAGPGRTWIAANDGIYELRGKDAMRLPGNHLIEGGVAATLTAALSGGWWATGPGVLQRIRPCATCAAGWEVIEQPRRGQGLPGNTAIMATEDGHGNLWIAGNRGVWRVPKTARATPLAAPRVALVRVGIDDVPQAIDGEARMPHDAHRIELEYAALSYRDQSLLRYRSRLNGHAWSTPSRSPVLQFVAPEPGTYDIEMSASLDGAHWSNAPVPFRFRVLPPWYRTWWSRLLFTFAGIAMVVWIYRLRVAALLRVERERTRIAMDLHDELGTGLGSIGMLAGVAAREDLDAGERRRLANEIANLSGLLGSGLRSLVWSLRSGRAGLPELSAQIVDHARRLFPDDKQQLVVQMPVHARDEPLPVELRRNVLLLALEALHNVARHAGASRVVIALQANAPGGLRLSVEDDGRGFEVAQCRAGAGLESMRRRASAIGAAFTLDSAPGRGTRIILEWRGQGRIA